METSSKSKHCCNFCGKNYTRKISYNRHLILCEVIFKTKREKKCEEEETSDTPSRQQLYDIIQELALKQTIMEKKMEEMQKWVEKKKRKMNIIAMLNGRTPPAFTFEEWKTKIFVGQEDIRSLMENNVIQVMQNIIQRNLTSKSGELFPITCFVQKANMFYICENNKPTANWTYLTQEILSGLLKCIHYKLLTEINAWREINADAIKYNDKMSEMYNKLVIKLMNIEFNQETTMTKIRTHMHGYLKIDLKNVFEQDYEF
jgi:hypothetical protein